ncbi:MAG: hypothetical protein OXE41_11230 [Gammaproteobacteria bacterium]|nr:hypothetical protein [Gammaproteobacteria bacterium]
MINLSLVMLEMIVPVDMGSTDEQERLISLSEYFFQWENNNLVATSTRLPCYSGGKKLQYAGEQNMVRLFSILSRMISWVRQIGYIISRFFIQVKGKNGLLLVGVEKPTSIGQLLTLTHPLYTGGRVANPKNLITDITGRTVAE